MMFGNSTLRGGQTVFHGIRMWGQLLRAGMFLAAISTVAVPAWHVWHNTTGYEWYAAAMVTVAEMKLAIGYRKDSGQEIRMSDGSTTVLTITEIAASPRALYARERLKDEIIESAFLGLRYGVIAILALLVVFWLRGRQLNRKKRIRGAELATPMQLRRQVLSTYAVSARVGHALSLSIRASRARPYRIADVPYPERAETQHTIVSGTTGSGKTVLISDLVAQIRERGERWRHLRQDGQLHSFFLRFRTGCSPEPPGRPRPAMVSFFRSKRATGFRHDGGGPDPPAGRIRWIRSG